MPAGSPTTDDDADRTGVLIGSGIGGLEGIAESRGHPEGDAGRAASRRSSSPAA